MSSTKPNNPRELIALIDCNNFFVSCERVFNPKLNKFPVAVLSNNDGCVIARSKEVKELGIPMGAPAFEWKDVFRKNGVVVLSSNFALYGDMSGRVMSTLAQFSSDVQIYSIDEAFLKLPASESARVAPEIRNTILRWTGLPVSVGVSLTKTLSKIANRYAKKDAELQGYFVMDDPLVIETCLKKLPVQDVWGIGRRTADFLYRYGIRTAWEYTQCEDAWLKKHLSIVGLRMAWELRGISCLELNDEPAPKKSILSSRSFGVPVLELQDLEESISMHTANVAEDLRSQGNLASYIEVFVTTNLHKEGEYYAPKMSAVLPEPTSYTPTLITFAKAILKQIYRKGLYYKRAGVLVAGIVPENCYQPDLFVKHNPLREKQQVVSQIVDTLNRRYGHSILKYAAEGLQQEWRSKRSYCTPRYTTRWEEVLRIRNSEF